MCILVKPSAREQGSQRISMLMVFQNVMTDHHHVTMEMTVDSTDSTDVISTILSPHRQGKYAVPDRLPPVSESQWPPGTPQEASFLGSSRDNRVG